MTEPTDEQAGINAAVQRREEIGAKLKKVSQDTDREKIADLKRPSKAELTRKAGLQNNYRNTIAAVRNRLRGSS